MQTRNFQSNQKINPSNQCSPRNRTEAAPVQPRETTEEHIWLRTCGTCPAIFSSDGTKLSCSTCSSDGRDKEQHLNHGVDEDDCTEYDSDIDEDDVAFKGASVGASTKDRKFAHRAFDDLVKDTSFFKNPKHWFVIGPARIMLDKSARERGLLLHLVRAFKTLYPAGAVRCVAGSRPRFQEPQADGICLQHHTEQAPRLERCA